MAVTLTLALADKNGVAIFSRASLAEGTTHRILSDKYDELGTTIVEGKLIRTPMVGPATLTITSSVTTSATFTGWIFYENAGRVGSYPFSITLTNAASGTQVLPDGVSGYFLGASLVAGALASPSTSPSASTSPSTSVSPSLSPSASVSPSRSASPSSSVSPSRSPSTSVSPSASVSPSSSPSAGS